MKTKIQDKIYWFCFKRQLKELYYLLFAEGYISSSWDEFSAHFTGKKFPIEKKYTKKLKWEKSKYTLTVLINYLFEKGFLKYSDNALRHFNNVSNPVSEKYRPQNQKTAKEFQLKLNQLFPARSGYRCKERLYYKSRNKEPLRTVLKGLIGR